MKQTAVEWLFLMLNNPNSNQEFANKLLEKSKAMDKVEKEYFFECGRQYQLTGEGTFTEVYNETFKKTL